MPKDRQFQKLLFSWNRPDSTAHQNCRTLSLHPPTHIKAELANVMGGHNLAALWLTRLVVGLSSQRLRFDPRLVDEEFVEDRMALGQGLLRVLRLPYVNIIFPKAPYTFIGL
jgi:hypothetical protein